MRDRSGVLFTFSLILFLLVTTSAAARPRTDTIVVVNGNSLNGEILQMSRAMLTLHTDSLSVVRIKWEDITQIQSDHQFVVEDTNGVRYTGTLGTSSDGKVEIIGNSGTVTVDHISVVTIFPLKSRWYRRFDGSVDFSYSYTKASSGTQFSLASDVRYLSSRWWLFFNTSSILSIANGQTNADRNATQLGGARYLGKRWYWLAETGYDHNSELNLEHRFLALGGIGRRLHQTNRSLIGVVGGISYSRELYTGEPTTNSAQAVIDAQFQFFKLYSPKVDVVVEFTVYPYLTTKGRVRTELSVQSNIELVRDFYWTLNFYDSYDSKPPDINSVKNDYGVITGISWTFNR